MFLALTADLNGVTNFAPDDSEESPYEYTFTVQCTRCRETHGNAVSFNRFETTQKEGSRGDMNFVWKCGNCDRTNTASIKGSPKAYKRADPPTRQNIIELECRGLEFISFDPIGLWRCEGEESGSKFEEIDFKKDKEKDSDPDEWYGYDEKSSEEVSITALKWEIRRS